MHAKHAQMAVLSTVLYTAEAGPIISDFCVTLWAII